MKEIDNQGIKEIELEILTEFARICDEQGFRYSLIGGTLIGAVRHKGFIPWDDDIDVIMPRPDYEKFCDYCIERNTPFDLLTYKTKKGYWSLSGKICSKETLLVDDLMSRSGLQHGIYIDVFPVDGMGNTFGEAKRRFYHTELLRDLVVASNWKTYFRSKTHSLLFEPIRILMYVISRFVNPEKIMMKIDRYNTKSNFDESEYCASISGSYRLKEIMRRKFYSEYSEVEFEGHIFSAPKYYDEVLKNYYGNYMELPPEEKRITHHTFKAYYK